MRTRKSKMAGPHSNALDERSFKWVSSHQGQDVLLSNWCRRRLLRRCERRQDVDIDAVDAIHRDDEENDADGNNNNDDDVGDHDDHFATRFC